MHIFRNTPVKIKERLNELMVIRGINNTVLASKIAVNNVTVGRWLNGKNGFKLNNCIKLVDYFNCFIDFLVGRSETLIDFTPKPCPPFYVHLRKLMKNIGVSRNEINRNTTVKSSHFVDWSRGTEPHIYSLVEIAEYLDVSLDELVGRDS